MRAVSRLISAWVRLIVPVGSVPPSASAMSGYS